VSNAAIHCRNLLLLLLLPQVLLDFDGHTTNGTKYNSMFSTASRSTRLHRH
jgi:hypothetical protein